MKKLIANLFVIVFLTLIFGHLSDVHAFTSIRLEQPKTPTYLNNFNLIFTVLDTDNPANITVQCFKKGPSDSGFSQFGSNINITTSGGDTGNCPIDGSVVSVDGTYSFKVMANSASDTVSIDYNAGGPGTPQSYSKEQIDSCHYKINFRSADDGGKTVKVEVYHSASTSFTADAGTRVYTANIGSSTDGTFTDNVPDCNRTWYYVVRAFDKFGNGSGTIGDSVVTVTTTTVASTPAAGGGAIPVTTGNIPGQGETLGAKAGSEEAGVLGATAEASPEVKKIVNPQKLNKKNMLIAGLGIIVITAIIYVILRKKNQTSL